MRNKQIINSCSHFSYNIISFKKRTLISYENIKQILNLFFKSMKFNLNFAIKFKVVTS
jgi:hypothetical protein